MFVERHLAQRPVLLCVGDTWCELTFLLRAALGSSVYLPKCFNLTYELSDCLSVNFDDRMMTCIGQSKAQLDRAIHCSIWFFQALCYWLLTLSLYLPKIHHGQLQLVYRVSKSVSGYLKSRRLEKNTVVP